MEKSKLYRTAFNLSLFLVVYNIIEGLLSTFFGYEEGSLTLFGFGIDSFIEVISGFGILQMITRIRLNPDSNRNNYERAALRITGFAFYALVVGLLITSVYNFISGHKPETTLFGVIISSISIIVMLLFIRFQTLVGKALDSKAILADVECTKICIYMSVVLLASSAIYALTKFSYTDNIGALALAYLSLREGMECFEKAKSDKHCSCE